MVLTKCLKLNGKLMLKKENQAKLIKMRDSAVMRALVRTAEDFTMEENEKYALLLENFESLK